MNHDQFFDDLKNGKIKNLYLFDGKDEFIKQQALKRLTEYLIGDGIVEMNYTQLNNPSVEDIKAICETLPMLCEKRVVVVKDYKLLKKTKDEDKEDSDSDLDDEETKAIVEYIGKIPKETCLVFYVQDNADGRKKLYKTIKKEKGIVTFSPMNDAEAEKWIGQTVRREGKTITTSVANKLLFVVGKDTALLKQEISKLVAYVNKRTAIEEKDIDAICVKSLEYNVFSMIDLQASGDNAKALRLLREVLDNGESEFLVLALFLRHYRILYHVAKLKSEGVSSFDMQNILGLQNFAITKSLSQVRKYSTEQLKKVYSFLYDYEYKLKSGKIQQEGFVENAFFMIACILEN